MNWQETLGLLGGLLGNIGIIPQIFRLFRYKSAHEISLPFVYLWVASTICWLTYGILFGMFSLIFWNSILLVLTSLVLFAKLKWGMNAKAERSETSRTSRHQIDFSNN